jgi:pimeloyl-ACP methyl ester carboxylesterase
MSNLTRALAIAITSLSITWPACADDLGKFLENAARQAVRDEARPRQTPHPQGPASRNPPQTLAVKTADGWTLVAHRYLPTGQRKPGAAPVILCHGLTYNALFWDLDPSCSFAENLASLGYDVWAVDLRGCGQSRKWVWKLNDAPEAVIGGAVRRLTHGKHAPNGYETLDPRFAEWDLDHHIAYDMPALVTLVRQHTGAAEVTWVGHSMGGIVAICHLARYPNPGIGKLVTIGSQVTMPQGQLARQFLEELVLKRQRQLTGQLQSNELANLTKTSVHDMFFNVQNASPQVYEALSGWATDVPAIGLMRQYMVLANTGELYDAKKQFNYAKALGNVKVPFFISCGATDQFAPPVVQRYLYDHVGSTDKTLVIFGRAQNFSADCGHDDSLVGLNSKTEVYPAIERWISGARQ